MAYLCPTCGTTVRHFHRINRSSGKERGTTHEINNPNPKVEKVGKKKKYKRIIIPCELIEEAGEEA